MATTQIVPRILEQSLLYKTPSKLNGKDKLVRFTYVNFNESTITQELSSQITAKIVDVFDTNGLKLLTVQSINQLLATLGIKSRRTLARHINNTKPFNSPKLGKLVTIVERGVTPVSKDIVHRTDKEKNLPALDIPGTSINELPLDLVHV